MGKSRKLTGGALIAARLTALGWTQSDLAEKLDVSTGTVSRWISEERSPTLAGAVDIADVLGIDVRDLVVTRTGTDG